MNAVARSPSRGWTTKTDSLPVPAQRYMRPPQAPGWIAQGLADTPLGLKTDGALLSSATSQSLRTRPIPSRHRPARTSRTLPTHPQRALWLPRLALRSEEHTSELQSPITNPTPVISLKNKKNY